MNPPQIKTKKIILHGGARKTGTTSLQFFFHDQEEALRRAGIAYPRRLIASGNVDPLQLAISDIPRKRRAESAIRDGRKLLDAVFEAPDIHTLLLSNETIFGAPVRAGKPQFFPDHAAHVANAARLFEGYDVEIVFFIRDLAAYLPSNYVQDVRLGLTWSLDRYMDSLDEGSISWAPLIRSLRATFGSHKVHLFDFEDLARKPAGTVDAAFGRFIPALPPFDSARYRRNNSMDLRTVRLYRLGNWLLEKFVAKPRRGAARRWMRDTIFAWLARHAGKKTPTLREPIRSRLAARYVAERPTFIDG